MMERKGMQVVTKSKVKQMDAAVEITWCKYFKISYILKLLKEHLGTQDIKNPGSYTLFTGKKNYILSLVNNLL